MCREFRSKGYCVYLHTDSSTKVNYGCIVFELFLSSVRRQFYSVDIDNFTRCSNRIVGEERVLVGKVLVQVSKRMKRDAVYDVCSKMRIRAIISCVIKNTKIISDHVTDYFIFVIKK